MSTAITTRINAVLRFDVSPEHWVEVCDEFNDSSIMLYAGDKEGREEIKQLCYELERLLRTMPNDSDDV